jgi:prophage DNA circulation protein
MKKEIAKIKLSMKKSADEIKTAVDTILAKNNSELDVMLDDIESKQQETEAYISSLQEVIQIYERGALTNTATEIFTLSKAIASLKIPDRSEPVLPEFRKAGNRKAVWKIESKRPKRRKRNSRSIRTVDFQNKF